MEGYKVEIIYASRELSAKERIVIKDTGDAIGLDQLTQEGPVIIGYDYHAILQIHNERSSSKDYQKVVIIDKAGTKYTTGSQAFIDSLTDIVGEMSEAGETDNIQLNVYRRESKNYAGKCFLNCSLI